MKREWRLSLSVAMAVLASGALTGCAVNPATGAPYEPNVLALGDYGRAIAEFWADGPMSETPPGHWNSIANFAVDELVRTGPLHIGGAGPDVNRLEYDVKTSLALNGAVHDAAIVAWGAKAHYDYVRPISMIRYMGGRGQSPTPMRRRSTRTACYWRTSS